MKLDVQGHEGTQMNHVVDEFEQDDSDNEE